MKITLLQRLTKEMKAAILLVFLTLAIPTTIILMQPTPSFIGNGYVEIRTDRGTIGGGSVIKSWPEYNKETKQTEEHTYIITANHVVKDSTTVDSTSSESA